MGGPSNIQEACFKRTTVIGLRTCYRSAAERFDIRCHGKNVAQFETTNSRRFYLAKHAKFVFIDVLKFLQVSVFIYIVQCPCMQNLADV